ncbi:hypothetical protein HNP40_001006 [Mycobacteroides chelonae]|nr:hypothetical protein [Mycobacteroides chelonae]
MPSDVRAAVLNRLSAEIWPAIAGCTDSCKDNQPGPQREKLDAVTEPNIPGKGASQLLQSVQSLQADRAYRIAEVTGIESSGHTPIADVAVCYGTTYETTVKLSNGSGTASANPGDWYLRAITNDHPVQACQSEKV